MDTLMFLQMSELTLDDSHQQLLLWFSWHSLYCWLWCVLRWLKKLVLLLCGVKNFTTLFANDFFLINITGPKYFNIIGYLTFDVAWPTYTSPGNFKPDSAQQWLAHAGRWWDGHLVTPWFAFCWWGAHFHHCIIMFIYFWRAQIVIKIKIRLIVQPY